MISKKLEGSVLMSILRVFSHYSRESIADVISKNLESHQVGCFKIGFSKGFRKCRFFFGRRRRYSIFGDKQFVP